jgi:hypothetical protein
LAVALSRRRLDELGDQLALLARGEMPAKNIGADDVGEGINPFV